MTDTFPGAVAFDRSHVLAAILSVSVFAPVVLLFAYAGFSFGYIVSFSFFTMIAGYLWLIPFSMLPYDHRLAYISIIVSGLLFILPSLFITSPARRLPLLSASAFDRLLSLMLLVGATVAAVGALYNFTPVGLSEIYKYRAVLDFPAPLRYALGTTSNALLPFAFAGFLERRSFGRAGIALLILLLLYPVTLTKQTLFAPFWLLYLAVLSTWAPPRLATILSLLLPMLAGILVFFTTQAGLFPLGIGSLYVGTVNSRMIAMPSVALEVYNSFFSGHPLTHFCQINLLKPLMSCPYDEPLSVIMSKAYPFGAFNASLFATEGIASVGPIYAPLSALGCGLIIALANRLSSGLPPRLVLVSSGLIVQALLNVPLSTNLLSNGALLLFVLWYAAPDLIAATGGKQRNKLEPQPAQARTTLSAG
ncbi:hypothetical protein G8O24_09130 [Bradyrhizobium sp. INPA01-394B]|uniref:Oligosaccharide repeat unit polymerase n=1 Tax=Bradyrhizobium campsiandrae TaxID=1729892 RepID=A0ABR7U8V8_9BRAD|nr:hypothetical protein [Bradyrhizobium campsiandrae]MBC9877510.1 hypothetical protein [Bradyrhizobium campsiandrae]MBC9980494.1 hypothetical protein [Bradyrhizobium campsiandrae]